MSAGAMHLLRYSFWQEASLQRAVAAQLCVNQVLLGCARCSAAPYHTVPACRPCRCVMCQGSRDRPGGGPPDSNSLWCCSAHQQTHICATRQEQVGSTVALTSHICALCTVLWLSLCVVHARESGNAHASSTTQRLCRMTTAMVGFELVQNLEATATATAIITRQQPMIAVPSSSSPVSCHPPHHLLCVCCWLLQVHT